MVSGQVFRTDELILGYHLVIWPVVTINGTCRFSSMIFHIELLISNAMMIFFILSR